MFVVTLKFSDNKTEAGAHMAGHKDWIQQGFAKGLFLMVGSLQPNQGGGILAHNTSREDLEAFVQEDPFVSENVVTAEVMEITPARVDNRLEFLAA
ncbi:MAG: YciI family protein [Roseibium sp.]